MYVVQETHDSLSLLSVIQRDPTMEKAEKSSLVRSWANRKTGFVI